MDATHKWDGFHSNHPGRWIRKEVKMKYRVSIELSSIRSMEFDFDNFMDAATFATMAAEHGISKEYNEEDKTLDVYIRLIKK